MRRGHGYTKELTDELMASMKTNERDLDESCPDLVEPGQITSLSDIPTDPIMLNPKSIRNLAEK